METSSKIRLKKGKYNKSRFVISSSNIDFVRQRKTQQLNLDIVFITSILLLISLFGVIYALGESDLLANDEEGEVDKCEACRLFVKSFEKGLDETSRGKHEGGDTSWEEKNLKSYADSEVRLVEIQERLCEGVKRGKAQCLSLAENTEGDVDRWWFKFRNKGVRLQDFLCINLLKVCCSIGNFGPNCQPCSSNCSEHGTCDGSGTRSGTGKCFCEQGYTGDKCENCAEDHFRVDTHGQFTCLKCDPACYGCYGIGRTNCTECRTGYYKHETSGCIDINECDVGVDANGRQRLCKDNTYCVNTDGSYKCADCHVSCSGCVGYGPNLCLSCAQGYQLDDDYICRSLDELEEMEEWGRDEEHRKNERRVKYILYLIVFSFSMMRIQPPG